MIPDAHYDAIRDWLLRRTSWNIDARCCVAQNEGVYAAARYALQIFAKPGDKVVILTPVHFCFKEIINLNGRKGIECPLVLTDNSYEINFSGLEACLASGAKVLWLCNPHTPVGRGWTKAELSRIADLCLKYQAYIILDDVYSGLIFPSKEYTPIASLSKEISYRTITLYSTSKSYNTAGLRQAFIVAENPEIHKRYTELLTSANQHYGQNKMGLAASSCDVPLFTHIKSMWYTTVPGTIICLIIYTIMGLRASGSIDVAAVSELSNGLASNFNINLIHIIPVALVLILSVKQVPAFIAFGIGILSGIVWSMVFQGRGFLENLGFVMNGFSIDSGVKAVDTLVNCGGFSSMLSLV